MDIFIYQGDNPDALKNVLVGQFSVEGLSPTPDPNDVLCRMSLDIDGILHVTAIEKRTGLSKHITISNAFEQRSEEEIAESSKRLDDLYQTRQDKLADLVDAIEIEDDGPVEAEEPEPVATPAQAEGAAPEWAQAIEEAQALLARSRDRLDQMHDEDKEEAIGLHEQIESAIESHNVEDLSGAVEALRELLFFIEGK